VYSGFPERAGLSEIVSLSSSATPLVQVRRTNRSTEGIQRADLGDLRRCPKRSAL
jgi:hypothetical protein